MLLNILILLAVNVSAMLVLLFFMYQLIKVLLFNNLILTSFYLLYMQDGKVRLLKGYIATICLKKIRKIKQKEASKR